MLARFKHFNWMLFASMLALVAYGTISIWSAGNARAAEVFHGMWWNNLETALVGLALYFTLALVDYRKLLNYLAIPAYLFALLMLVAVLVFGDTVYGGKRWLWFFQPSEVAKLCVIMLVASLFGRDDTRLAACKPTFRGFLLASALVGVPCALILAEPDLGTTLALVPATACMLFVARVWRRGLVVIALTVGVLVAAVVGAVYEAERPGVPEATRERILRYVPLRPHQLDRVTVFLFPNRSPRPTTSGGRKSTADGYNLRQAQIAIASGGMRGKGLGKGETNRLRYLPPSVSMNDFIFCVFAEEHGFLGSDENRHLMGTLQLLALFALLLLPCCWIAFVSRDGRGRLLALGVATLIFVHVYINVGMSLGLVPITGLPLPFISSGRTFLLTILCGLGLVQSVSMHRE